MPKTTVNREVRWSRFLDAGILKRIEELLSPINPEKFRIHVTFSNKYKVECASIDEVMRLPASGGHSIKRLWFRVVEASASVEDKSHPTIAMVTVQTDFTWTRFEWDIDGEYDRCTSLDKQMSEIATSSWRPLRSFAYAPYFITDIVVVGVLPPLLEPHILSQFQVGISKEAFFLYQITIALIYIGLKAVLFPRVEIGIGYNGKFDNVRRRFVGWIFSILVVAGISAIVGEYWIQSYFGPR
ncbi:hypothetical protein AAIH46_01355 [Rhizobium sp. 0TCS1.26]|uniref:hypothetical protein n=1 Tax=Rhizobium sp. 0TCS1.26 TaxID=3142623 RepID=UPI003D283808